MFCRTFFVLLYFALLPIVLFVLLGYTDYDYPFGSFKLILNKNCLVIGTVHISNKTEHAIKENKSYW
jgi:hypothetical protein